MGGNLEHSPAAGSQGSANLQPYTPAVQILRVTSKATHEATEECGPDSRTLSLHGSSGQIKETSSKQSIRHVRPPS